LASTKLNNPSHIDAEPLVEELQDYYSDGDVRHPLFVGSVNPARAAVVNDLYRQKTAQVEKAFADQDWEYYVGLHARPYRVDALMECIEAGLTGSKYWEMLGSVWIDSENVRENLSTWKRLWSSDIPGRHLAMDEAERVWLAGMSETFPVWRGTNYQRSIKGLSWTVDAEKAKRFARRFQKDGQKCFVASGLVAKADVYAAFLGRQEHEIVAARVKVEEVVELT
jgi:hypothetical protein